MSDHNAEDWAERAVATTARTAIHAVATVGGGGVGAGALTAAGFAVGGPPGAVIGWCLGAVGGLVAGHHGGRAASRLIDRPK